MSLCWNTKQNSKTTVVDNEVEESYLAGKKLETLPDFSRFKFLKRLYLNNNKILHLNEGLKRNYVLSELYLQNNKLIDITDCLQHLTCLQILLLHSNQLTNLTDAVHEIRCMRNLKILNLFNNPLAQEYDYRNYVVHHVKSLELFDRKAVAQCERSRSSQHYDETNQITQQKIAFGTHVPHTGDTNEQQNVEYLNSTKNESNNRSMENDIEDNLRTELELDSKMTREDRIQALTTKRMDEYSSMRYRMLDWNEILNTREQFCNNNNNNNSIS